MSFVCSGYVYPTFGWLRLAGRDGFHWSSTAFAAAPQYAYFYDFTVEDVFPGDHYAWAYGFWA